MLICHFVVVDLGPSIIAVFSRPFVFRSGAVAVKVCSQHSEFAFSVPRPRPRSPSGDEEFLLVYRINMFFITLLCLYSGRNSRFSFRDIPSREQKMKSLRMDTQRSGYIGFEVNLKVYSRKRFLIYFVLIYFVSICFF